MISTRRDFPQEIVAGFEILDPLGGGVSGQAFAARVAGATGRATHVLKQPRGDFSPEEKEKQSRDIRREAEALLAVFAQLKHWENDELVIPAVPFPVVHQEVPGRGYVLISEKAPGVPLVEVPFVLGHRVRSETTVLSILLGSLRLLLAAEAAGRLYNDVQLKHIFWDADRRQLTFIDWANALTVEEGEEKGRSLDTDFADLHMLVIQIVGPDVAEGSDYLTAEQTGYSEASADLLQKLYAGRLSPQDAEREIMRILTQKLSKEKEKLLNKRVELRALVENTAKLLEFGKYPDAYEECEKIVQQADSYGYEQLARQAQIARGLLAFYNFEPEKEGKKIVVYLLLETVSGLLTFEPSEEIIGEFRENFALLRVCMGRYFKPSKLQAEVSLIATWGPIQTDFIKTRVETAREIARASREFYRKRREEAENAGKSDDQKAANDKVALLSEVEKHFENALGSNDPVDKEDGLPPWSSPIEGGLPELVEIYSRLLDSAQKLYRIISKAIQDGFSGFGGATPEELQSNLKRLENDLDKIKGLVEDTRRRWSTKEGINSLVVHILGMRMLIRQACALDPHRDGLWTFHDLLVEMETMAKW